MVINDPLTACWPDPLRLAAVPGDNCRSTIRAAVMSKKRASRKVRVLHAGIAQLRDRVAQLEVANDEEARG